MPSQHKTGRPFLHHTGKLSQTTSFRSSVPSNSRWLSDNKERRFSISRCLPTVFVKAAKVCANHAARFSRRMCLMRSTRAPVSCPYHLRQVVSAAESRSISAFPFGRRLTDKAFHIATATSASGVLSSDRVSISAPSSNKLADLRLPATRCRIFPPIRRIRQNISIALKSRRNFRRGVVSTVV